MAVMRIQLAGGRHRRMGPRLSFLFDGVPGIRVVLSGDSGLFAG
jgi:hypothetical protein